MSMDYKDQGFLLHRLRPPSKLTPPLSSSFCNAEKKTTIDDVDGSKEPGSLLYEYGIISGEKLRSDVKFCSSEAGKKIDFDVDTLIQKKVAIKADNNKPSARQNLASGGANGDETSKACKSKFLSPSDESNIHIAVGEGSQGHDCLLHDNALTSEETMKFNKQIQDSENKNNDFGVCDADNDSNGKSFQELKVLASSLEERILKAERIVAWLKERRVKREKNSSSSLDLGVDRLRIPIACMRRKMRTGGRRARAMETFRKKKQVRSGLSEKCGKDTS